MSVRAPMPGDMPRPLPFRQAPARGMRAIAERMPPPGALRGGTPVDPKPAPRPPGTAMYRVLSNTFMLPVALALVALVSVACDDDGQFCFQDGRCFRFCGDDCTSGCSSVDDCVVACGDRCRYACTSSANCALRCGRGCRATCQSTSTCHTRCDGDCSYACRDVNDCAPELGPNSEAVCERVGNCNPTCLGTCTVRCKDVGNCNVNCLDGASTNCGQGVRVCGRPCPDTTKS